MIGNSSSLDATTTTILQGLIPNNNLSYMYWVHWAFVLVKRTSLLAFSLPFCDAARCVQKMARRGFVAAIAVHRDRFSTRLLYKGSSKRADESISPWLLLVRWSLECTCTVDRLDAPLAVILVALFLLPDDDENSVSLLLGLSLWQ